LVGRLVGACDGAGLGVGLREGLGDGDLVLLVGPGVGSNVYAL